MFNGQDDFFNKQNSVEQDSKYLQPHKKFLYKLLYIPRFKILIEFRSLK